MKAINLILIAITLLSTPTLAKEPAQLETFELHEFLVRFSGGDKDDASNYLVGVRDCKNCYPRWYRFDENSRIKGISKNKLKDLLGTNNRGLYLKIDKNTGAAAYFHVFR